MIATTLAHRSHGEVSVCTEQILAAEKISWPTLADMQPTRGVQTCNMVFNIYFSRADMQADMLRTCYM